MRQRLLSAVMYAVVTARARRARDWPGKETAPATTNRHRVRPVVADGGSNGEGVTVRLAIDAGPTGHRQAMPVRVESYGL